MIKNGKWWKIVISLSQVVIWPPLIFFIVHRISEKENGNSPLPQQGINPVGGTLKNSSLVSSKYKDLVEMLDLTPLTRLSTLTTNQLNQKLITKGQGGNYQVTIQPGSSESRGILILKVTSSHANNHWWSEITKVTGFETYANNKLSLQNISLDFSKWFDNHFFILAPDLRGKSDFAQISTKLLTELITSADLYLNSITAKIPIKYSLLDVFKAIGGLQVNLKQTNSYSQYQIAFAPYQLQQKEFWNGGWNKIEKTITLQQDTTHQTVFNPPSYKDLLDQMIKEVAVKQGALSNYYPSLFKGRHQFGQIYDSDLTYLVDATNWDDVVKKYQPTYFQNQRLKLSIGDQDFDLQANDYDGTLKFNLKLCDPNNPATYVASRLITVLGMKKINDFLQKAHQSTNNIIIQFASQLHSQLLSYLQQNHQLAIQSLFDKGEAPLNVLLPKNIVSPQGLAHYWYLDNAQEAQYLSTKKLIQKFYGQLSLFNKPLTIDEDDQSNCHLKHVDEVKKHKNIYFCGDTNDGFYVQMLKFEFPTKLLLTITRINDHLISLNFHLSTKVQLIGGEEELFLTQFSCQLTKQQFNKNSPKLT